MKIVDKISYDTELTMNYGAVRSYSHEYPSIGLAINHKIPVLFVITDHEPVNSTDMSCTFDESADGPSIVFFKKGLNLDAFYEEYYRQPVSAILEEKELIDEILEYPIHPDKFNFVKETLENSGSFVFIRIVVEDIQAFNDEMAIQFKQKLANDPDLENLSEIELEILLGSNQLTYFDIFGMYDWIEESKSLSLDTFPIKSGKVHISTIKI